MSDIDVVDIKSLRKKYLKKRICIDRFDKHDVFVNFDKNTKELGLEFTYLESWSGNENTYTITMVTDDDFVINKIYPLKGEHLICDDARGSTYRGKRTDDYDYWLLDCILNPAVADGKE